MNNVKNILRWILVLPSMIITHILAYYIYLWIFGGGRISFFRHLEVIIAFMVSGIVSIVVGSLVAPYYKKTVSIILCVFSCTLMLVGLAVMISRYSEYGIMGVMGNVATIIGCIIGAYFIHKNIIEIDSDK